jgi:hypothetical protein
MPFQRLAEQVAEVVCGQHLQHCDRRQLVGIAVGLAPLLQMPLLLQLLQDALEVDPRRALDVPNALAISRLEVAPGLAAIQSRICALVGSLDMVSA